MVLCIVWVSLVTEILERKRFESLTAQMKTGCRLPINECALSANKHSKCDVSFQEFPFVQKVIIMLSWEQRNLEKSSQQEVLSLTSTTTFTFLPHSLLPLSLSLSTKSVAPLLPKQEVWSEGQYKLRVGASDLMLCFEQSVRLPVTCTPRVELRVLCSSRFFKAALFSNSCCILRTHPLFTARSADPLAVSLFSLHFSSNWFLVDVVILCPGFWDAIESSELESVPRFVRLKQGGVCRPRSGNPAPSTPFLMGKSFRYGCFTFCTFIFSDIGVGIVKTRTQKRKDSERGVQKKLLFAVLMLLSTLLMVWLWLVPLESSTQQNEMAGSTSMAQTESR